MAYYVFQNLDGKGSCIQVYKIACVGWERGREGRRKGGREWFSISIFEYV